VVSNAAMAPKVAVAVKKPMTQVPQKIDVSSAQAKPVAANSGQAPVVPLP